jgi:hypothetical protein
MTYPQLFLPRRTAARLLRVGDDISVAIRSDGIRSVGYGPTVTMLEDEESNRRIRVTAHIHSTDEIATIGVEPGDVFDRLIDRLRLHPLGSFVRRRRQKTNHWSGSQRNGGGGVKSSGHCVWAS